MLIEGQALSYDAIDLFVDELNACEHVKSASLLGTKKRSWDSSLVGYTVGCSLIE